MLDHIYLRAVNRNMLLRYQQAKDFKNALQKALAARIPGADTTISLGRSAENDICYPQGTVSGFHLDIRGVSRVDSAGHTQHYLLVIDHSTNGTGVNGRLLKNTSEYIPYTGTAALPQVMLAGRTDAQVDWPQVMRLLHARGWNPERAVAVAPPPPEDGLGGQRGSTPPTEGPQLPPGEYVPSGRVSYSPADRLSGGMAFLCFCFPVVGWILGGVWRAEYPNKARKAAMMAWCSFALWMSFTVLGFMLLLVMD